MAGKVGFVSLGCPKALVDSEQILSRLRAEGYETSPTYEDAEVVVVNTCGFITPAVEESLSAIGEALAENGKVIVTGCLGARPEVIKAAHPEVLEVTGPGQVDKVLEAVHRIIPPDTSPFTTLIPPQVKLTPRHYAYLKIAEGCNHKCSFCIIPKLRGLQVSREAGEILSEATRLVSTGTKELLVIAQDTSAYGVDIRHRASEFQGRQVRAHLVDLVNELAELGAWVRLHYVYPYPHVKQLVPLMAQGKILPYLDVPLQHASPRILRAMRRPGGAESHLKTIQEWREIAPDLAIRSSFIVGFPGETEEDFTLLLEFLAEAKLDRVGCFTYSEVEGADANALAGRVPEEVKEERRARLMELQQSLSLEKNRAKVGQTLEVIVDDYGEEPGVVVGRSKYDAPGIDGLVYAETDGTVKIGDLIRVHITRAEAYDLYGKAVGNLAWEPRVPRWGMANTPIRL
ncbi:MULTISPECIES: 30S ribosomal protein S12 methylthiotransferase RimO [unclassified Meiothermus]|uniref:30S ribosomal protein S12 methylthiotransferase RimO n=1 Tax=unclassified Meiothermus TaxID=370471 RepID=UPI000D7C7FC2|nr:MULTISPECIES: 30S ribosomal protein S12 methylthiotransferase RimO [unclassified Meiothermus]PZA08957.1 30S ribosomal protein S12 methylthiotransferase RimO [Meiothermus sp. Pnk-1]RYM33679.1 30S ribosomal protein S12 methylthiotransferase RimO [Meiothermus sp. PNK-Is4]